MHRTILLGLVFLLSIQMLGGGSSSSVRANGVSEEEVKAIIVDAAHEFGCDPDWMLYIAWRESRYEPWVTNRYSGAAGLYQYLPSTWAHTDFASESPYDPVASSRATAKWCSEGYTSPWRL